MGPVDQRLFHALLGILEGDLRQEPQVELGSVAYGIHGDSHGIIPCKNAKLCPTNLLDREHIGRRTLLYFCTFAECPQATGGRTRRSGGDETMLQQARSAAGAAARRLGRSLDGMGAALETHPYHEQCKRIVF